jgi:Family of unknown function (DUF6069)
VTRSQHIAPQAPVRPPIDAGRLWAAGVATAVVAALTAIVGFLVARGLFGIPVLAPKSDGVWGNANTPTYALFAALAALAATGVMHLLIRYTPSPLLFFGWLMFLATATAVLAPFANSTVLSASIVTSIINLAIGMAIWTLISGAAQSALRLGAARVAAGDVFD